MSQSVGRTRLAYSRTWHHIDVGSDPRSLGRVASSIALFLMGKNKPIYDPSTDCGDYVVAVGCQKIHTTGKKRFQKLYYTHSTRPGGLKSMSMDKMFEKWGGAEVLRRAVKGMLPKNKLREVRMARLKAFEGKSHPYRANIVKYGGKSVLGELPDVCKAFQRTRESPTVR
ncbi:54S ribosomal protein L23, mitochondrial [Ophidiomyces ophidiicola]|uniref:54S ribosomal protein L23, mitochondrial n=1 Tax=Ophidiomyces ophidiicola TaxID=1387563 RepID=A0ACB8UTR6_9EURO|nr:54S ribosomal protein L23, mitochondrial [Ophidiomyces ophidiicola]KAI1907623.1 54S ribosomal protein L23, mitochondrial [Ophidiomyces ophidiicola]KAI1908403.1 54S ribosomal protein L23, mitochondrial [Ophidiomyces ophidiicola]KAI1922885.1 54S ribosomal protein L23, mitochondrial [Ophidiomyces ophidiicola]KAI1939846.1 54S ribosomal protein L23, mitochondrial [Ophidiomyces ophidiicola]KAI1951971.1 54S ribosomal protein L23, mitochondrial [Ophidiomyces ophidiicola]